MTTEYYYTSKNKILSDAVILKKLEKRSFIECCLTCDFITGSCAGVAYNDMECNLLDQKHGGKPAEEENKDYQVMWLGNVVQGNNIIINYYKL